MGEIELVMLVEEVFDVQIPAEEAEQLQTAGELEAWLLKHLRARMAPVESLPCLNVVAFNRARRVLGTTLPSGERLRPQTPLESVLPPLQAGEARRALWSRLEANGLGLPSLKLPSPLGRSLETLYFAAACLSPFFALPWAFNFANNSYLALGMGAIGFLVYFLILGAISKSALSLLNSLAVHSPFQTVGEIAEYAVAHNYWKLAEQRGAWSDAELWRVLQKLIARESGVEPDQVRRDSSWDALSICD